MDSPLPSKGIIFDFDGTLYGDWRLWISLIEETLREFNLSVTAYEALELARNEIRTGGAKETIKISGIAVSLAREQGLERDDEVRLRFFEKLDATATLARAQATMRRLGFASIPRGRRADTRANRFGLTRREQEVLTLVTEGLTNADIAARLFIAEKTVDNHVSSVLAKMNVDSRHEAARLVAAI